MKDPIGEMIKMLPGLMLIEKMKPEISKYLDVAKEEAKTKRAEMFNFYQDFLSCPKAVQDKIILLIKLNKKESE